MCIWKNNFFSKVAPLITLLVFKKKSLSIHVVNSALKGKINKTLKLRKTFHIMARRPVHIFKPLTKTLHSSTQFISSAAVQRPGVNTITGLVSAARLHLFPFQVFFSLIFSSLLFCSAPPALASPPPDPHALPFSG